MSFKKTYGSLLIIFFFLLLSCRGREVVIPNPFEGERLVLLGRLETGKPIRIQIGKTFSPMGDVPEAPWVNDAKVEVYKNGDFLTELDLLNERGVYGSDLLIETGQTYVIKAKAEGMPEVETEKVWVTDEQLQFSYQRIRDYDPVKKPHADLLRISFTNQEQMENNMWGISGYGVFDDKTYYSFTPSATNILINEDGCAYGGANLINPVEEEFRGLLLFNGDCVSTKMTYDFYIKNEIYDPNSISTNESKYIPASRLYLESGKIPEEVFEFYMAEQGQPDGLDILLLATQNSYTNIKNGYGLVYALNLTEITLK